MNKCHAMYLAECLVLSITCFYYNSAKQSKTILKRKNKTETHTQSDHITYCNAILTKIVSIGKGYTCRAVIQKRETRDLDIDTHI